jgi:catechol 2,3-dioxygenase-like lactoylglutathione lyase family enzyme
MSSLFQSIHPIGDTDPQNLPVADVTQATVFYTDVMGFQVVDTHDGPPKSVTLRRDDVTLSLAETGADPEQASCYISVRDVSGLQAEYKRKGLDVSGVGPLAYDGRQHEVFWAKDPDGLCYCLGRQID